MKILITEKQLNYIVNEQLALGVSGIGLGQVGSKISQSATNKDAKGRGDKRTSKERVKILFDLASKEKTNLKHWQRPYEDLTKAMEGTGTNKEGIKGVLGLVKNLNDLSLEFPGFVTNSRGTGLFAAFDLPSQTERDDLINKLLKNNLLMLPSGDQSIRFRPHLNVIKK